MVRPQQGAAGLHLCAERVQVGEMRRPALLALLEAVRLIDAGSDEEHCGRPPTLLFRLKRGCGELQSAARLFAYSSPFCGRPRSAPTAPATSSEPSTSPSTQLE